MIERVGTRDDSPDRHKTIRRLEPDDAAIGSGHAHRAAGVGAERPHGHVRDHGGGRASRRTGRYSIESPRVAHWQKISRDRSAAHGELLQIGLADNHSSGISEAPDDFSIGVGKALVEYRAATSSARAGGIDIVFECDRNAVQGSTEFTGSGLSVQLRGPRERLFMHNGDVGVDLRIVGFDAVQAASR